MILQMNIINFVTILPYKNRLLIYIIIIYLLARETDFKLY